MRDREEAAVHESVDKDDGAAAMSRRVFLAAGCASAIAAPLVAGFGQAEAGWWRGEPFSDGTFFDDGTGWID